MDTSHRCALSDLCPGGIATELYKSPQEDFNPSASDYGPWALGEKSEDRRRVFFGVAGRMYESRLQLSMRLEIARVMGLGVGEAFVWKAYAGPSAEDASTWTESPA